MKRVIVILTVVVFLGAVHLYAAQNETASKQPLRIAYVDLDRIAANSKAVQNKIDSVEQELRGKQKNYVDKTKELRELQARIEKQASVMSADQIAQIKTQMAKLQDDLKYLEFEYNKTLDSTSRTLIEPVLDDILTVVKQVAEKHQIDLVLRGDLVLFSSERVDITDVIVQELDRSMVSRSKESSEKTPKDEKTEKSLIMEN